MSSLVDYAREELNIAGLLDQDSDYDGMLGTAALEIVEVFAQQGHSGMSAMMVTGIVEKLMRYEPLTPLTYAPDEWIKHENDLWQNKRNPAVFSNDGGQTHYSVNDSQ